MTQSAIRNPQSAIQSDSPAHLLFTDGPQFDFFQAVRLLEKLYPQRRPVGYDAMPGAEVARFRTLLSLAFPPSAIHSIEMPSEDQPWVRLIQTFFGLTGPSGALPRHYTQTLLDLGRDVRGPERRSLGDWLALFDHRLTSLFYRSWEKYRFWLPYERSEAGRTTPDSFTQALFSFVGLGEPRLRNRLRVFVPNPDPYESEQSLARIDDLALLYYSGLFSQRPRNAHNLRALVADYFEMPTSIKQFHGQWLQLEKDSQTCLGTSGSLGIDAVAGDRVWDVQSKFRVRLGPLTNAQFESMLPDTSPQPERKTLFLLCQLTRLFVGPELDFDVQLVLQAAAVPACSLHSDGLGPRLGWNTWLLTAPAQHDAGDAVFAGTEVIELPSSSLNAISS
jgi:type VI secretion system protein ImpH